MARPLEGIRVIEIGNLIAGPFCGMLLAAVALWVIGFVVIRRLIDVEY